MRLDRAGNLIVADGAEGTVRQLAPHAYQQTGGQRRVVASRYRLSGGQVTISLGAYDHHRTLVIDPTVTLAYSTYLGGGGNDNGNGIAVDAAGNAYVTGFTESTDFPTKSPLQTMNRAATAGFPNAFVTKLSVDGKTLVYSTYLGGSGGDSSLGIAVDSVGDAYVTGATSSKDFPTQNAVPSTLHFPAATNAFVTKLNPTGSALVYSTYLGGGVSDEGYGIAVDSAGSAYVTGDANSSDFPTQNAEQGALGCAPRYCNNAFVTKLSVDGKTLVYSTYLGGSTNDLGNSIAVDGAGSAYVTGFARSTDFPTQNPEQPANAGSTDAFVAKLLAPAAASFALSVNTTGAGAAAASASGAVVSDMGGISCARAGGVDDRGTCSHSFTAGTVVRLTATPDAQSTASLSGACMAGPGAAGQPVSCMVTVDQARSVTATFTRQQSGGGGGGGGGGGFVLAPTVAQSCQASAVFTGGATLSAMVDPNGSATSAHFDYGTSSAYGSQTPEQPVGSDAQAHIVSASVSGLQPGTTYHCRVVATSSSGTAYGVDQTFMTAPIPPAGVSLAPTVQSSCLASGVSRTGASVSASINPNGQATSAQFQYGTSPGYGSQTPAVGLGSDAQDHQLRAKLAALKPNATYHCRVVASNATGTTYGADQTFTTRPGAGHHPRARGRLRAGLRLGSVTATAVRSGCNVEYSRVARAAQLGDSNCTAARLRVAGRIDSRADSERVTIKLHANVGGRCRSSCRRE